MLPALEKEETQLFTMDAKRETEIKETAPEGRILQTLESDPEAPIRKQHYELPRL